MAHLLYKHLAGNCFKFIQHTPVALYLGHLLCWNLHWAYRKI